ncbi:hypothetical protein L1887_07320 [Cichorium endivia]|nr:hypothetical protein L1887_07320 [Cichorium endivia]
MWVVKDELIPVVHDCYKRKNPPFPLPFLPSFFPSFQAILETVDNPSRVEFIFSEGSNKNTKFNFQSSPPFSPNPEKQKKRKSFEEVTEDGDDVLSTWEMEKLGVQDFKVGQLADIRTLDEEFRGSCFRCKIRDIILEMNRIKLDYYDFPNEAVSHLPDHATISGGFEKLRSSLIANSDLIWINRLRSRLERCTWHQLHE